VSQRISGVKGMNDLLPPDIAVWHALEAAAHETFRRFGYEEARTPVLEDTALFVRSVGEATDIVGKEMYTFQDKAGRSLSLRPEGTAPVVRAYIEHAVAQREPVTRWWYLGPMFRYERMKTGRYRQFWQVGAEAYGVSAPAQETELIDLAMQLFRAGAQGIRVELNSLGDPETRGVTSRRSGRSSARSERALRRVPGADGRTLSASSTARTPAARRCSLARRPSPTRSPARRGRTSRRCSGSSGCSASSSVNPRMVRGLDYYSRTTFEFVYQPATGDSALGTAGSVCGGGRYDGLVKELGGPDTPAVGWALGMDRLCLLLRAKGAVQPAHPELFVAVAEEGAADAALALVSRLRRAGHRVDFDARGGSLKSQMKRADKSGAGYALVLGSRELTSGEAQLKPLAGGEPLPVRLDALESALAVRR
jgi:histidyl-tRNA synthetase